MKYIEIDEELYRFIASKTERIGESASDILRRLLNLSVENVDISLPTAISQPSLESESSTNHNPVFNQAKAAVEKIIAEQSRVTQDSPFEEDIPTSTKIDFDAIVSQHLLSQQKGAVGRFMYLLSSLEANARSDFNKVLNVQGKGRLYFARSKQALLNSSKSSNPKEVASSGFWVTTNNNTAKKQTILTEVLEHLGCDSERAKSIAEHI
ncbi:replication initiation negative regulator SeqA [Shewanella livingstonensis]|uniref:Negative modulator of initiation of replication n=1 Tax=Shewanella livingstonensis TaxID=150120 RepID=A0A3G8LXG5_9GAMM|nr:replication initiation negative regulator SeqA [Shewanella livingstonensis]AZG73420.1 replication initiation negative regulator SeqA [Shewanella livingstonensis]